MALVWVDGFDNYGTLGDETPSGILSRKYTNIGTINWDVSDPRVEGNGFSMKRVGGAIVTPNLTSDTTMIVGFGLRLHRFYLGTGKGTVFEWCDGTTARLYAYMNLIDGLHIGINGYGLVGIIPARWYCWQYVEVKVDTSAGTVEAHLNGTTVFSESSLTISSINAVKLGYKSQPYFDDLYVCDGIGSKNNDFLGPRKVVTIRPDGDVGGFQDWVTGPTPGGNHYEMVYEEVCDDDTTYVEEDSTNQTDLYDCDAVSSDLSEVDGMMVCADTRKEEGDGDFNLRLPIRLSATVDEGSSIVVSETSYTTKSRISEDKPTTGDWTPSDVDSAQIGLKVPS